MKGIVAILFLSVGVYYGSCNKLKGNKLYMVVSVKRNGTGGEVTFKRYQLESTIYYECLPDSIMTGKLMELPKEILIKK